MDSGGTEVDSLWLMEMTVSSHDDVALHEMAICFTLTLFTSISASLHASTSLHSTTKLLICACSSVCAATVLMVASEHEAFAEQSKKHSSLLSVHNMAMPEY